MGRITNSSSRKVLRNRDDAGLIVNVSSGDLGNGVTNNTYIDFANLNYFRGVLSLVFTNTTIKIYGTADNSSVADADAEWTDITSAWTGDPSKTSSFDAIVDTDNGYSRLKIERVTTNATNTCAIRVQKHN